MPALSSMRYLFLVSYIVLDSCPIHYLSRTVLDDVFPHFSVTLNMRISPARTRSASQRFFPNSALGVSITLLKCETCNMNHSSGCSLLS
ncbi:hypothetical protein F4824DRAFT_480048 [Ustulina deusta]|nr:hypothetical protein F4824DRAFT_480048 [Ustulina deusta]